ncbi:MAG: endonuclease/exonuclease/phosphatase family protein [Saprospiraceae bacterium]
MNVELTAIAFCNLENLFDTKRDCSTQDEEFTPNGSKAWNEDKYKEKLNNLSRVISELGQSKTINGPILLGVAEVENRTVLRDLISQKSLMNSGYSIIHYDSHDSRGIDVALLYKSKYFKLIDSKSIPVYLIDSINGSKFTRDVLFVKGKISGEIVYILVNHWPSRRSGIAASKVYRNQVARLNRMLYDSICKIESDPAFIIMGDLNDNPTDESVRDILNAKKDFDYIKINEFFNPFYQNYKKGEGSLAYKDSWELYDQIILSHRFIKPKSKEYGYEDHQIFHQEYMIETEGHFKNYPKRSFSGDKWINGFSDHFPTIVYLSLQP